MNKFKESICSFCDEKYEIPYLKRDKGLCPQCIFDCLQEEKYKDKVSPIALHRGTIRPDTQSYGKYILEITIEGRRIRRKFSNYSIAETTLKVLQDIKELEYAKKMLSRWGGENRLTDLQLFVTNNMCNGNPRSKESLVAQREQALNIYKEINERLKKRDKGRELNLNRGCLGQKIYEYRKKYGITQKRLAEIFKVNRSTISTWENGIYSPHKSKIEKVERILRTIDEENLCKNV